VLEVTSPTCDPDDVCEDDEFCLRQISKCEGGATKSLIFNGGSDGARTRDLRRDRPGAHTETVIISTAGEHSPMH
jgi:hypothetical protein